MPRDDSKAEKATKAKPKKSKEKAPPIRLDLLKDIRVDEIGKHLKSAATQKSYNGHVNRAKAFLAEHVQMERAELERELAAAAEEEDSEDDPVRWSRPSQWNSASLDRLEQAFDSPPNEYSPYAMEMFLVRKCFIDGNSPSTADGIHAALKAHWYRM